jgi:hypothetical protein
MKRCPTCQRTYPDDAPEFCSNDGMRLVNEESGGFDPERTVMSSGLRVPEPVLPEPPQPPSPSAPPPAPPPQQYYTPEGTPPGGQPQQWQQPANYPAPPPPAQFAPQEWSPHQPPPQPAQPWGNPYQSPVQNAPYAPPYEAGGRSRALAIAALVTGCCAATIMVLSVFRDGDVTFSSMLALGILGLGLGVTALILALQKSTRFGGIPLAIAGLATGTAALVYYFTQ